MNFSENIKGVSGIYSAIHRATGLCYVGSSINIWKRRAEHLQKSRRGSMTRFHVALRNFGESEFDFEVLERCDKSDLLERERFYIVLLGAAEIDGFNSRENPCATYDAKASAITRARISASKKGIRPKPEHIAAQIAGQIGLKRTVESRLKISAALSGKPKSLQHRIRISESHMGMTQSPESNAKRSASLMGRKYSPESIAKMSVVRLKNLACNGPDYADNRKPIIATDFRGKLLHVFDSLIEAVSGLETPSSTLRYYLRTGRPTPAGMLVYYATIERPKRS